MGKIVATYFMDTDKGSVSQWTRSVKSQGYDGLVIDCGMSDQQKAELDAVGFRLAKPDKTHGVQFDYFAALASALQPGDFCLWAGLVPSNAEDFFVNDLTCVRDDLTLESLVLPIRNIKNRGDTANLIEKEVINHHGSVLGLAAIGGGRDSWEKFVDYFGFLYNSCFIENRVAEAQLALNMYAANFKNVKLLEKL